MRKITLAFGVLFVGLGVFVLVFSEGLRRWYSGFFLLLIGIVALLNALVRKDTGQE